MPEIVIIHDFASSPFEFMGMCSNLNIASEIISPPGHGASQATVTWADTADWLEEQIADLNVHNYFLYGHGLGGQLILSSLWQKPNFSKKIKGVILENVIPGFPDRDSRRAFRKKINVLEANFRDKPKTEALQEWFNQEEYADLPASEKELFLRNANRYDGTSLADTLHNLNTSDLIQPLTIKKANYPLLYLYGDNNKYLNVLPEPSVNKLNDTFQKTTFVAIPNAGQICHTLKYKDALLKEINNFIGLA